MYEQEADRVADQVLAAPAQAGVGCAPARIQSVAGQAAGQMGEAPASVDQVLAGPGRPLEPALRQDMEQRFGYDFSRVRVHAGAAAEGSARDVNAAAYTVGHDIVFGAGRFAPGTHEGRRLVAHELAHVVQQSASRGTPADHSQDGRRLSPLPTPAVQRRLLVTGKPVDIKALIDLLEPASGFTLKYDPTTKEVSVVAAVGRPPSFVLAALLEQVIDDPVHDAELNLGRRQPGVSFGAFPSSGAPLIQEIDIDDLSRLEARVLGYGAVYIGHEIAENYHAHTTGQGLVPAHSAGLLTERLVAGELVGPTGERVAEVTVDKGTVFRTVRDYENYFLVLDRDVKTDALVNAWKADRVNVGTFTVSGSEQVPAAALATVDAVADALRLNPSATVRIEVGGPDVKRAERRAVRIQEAILASGKDRQLVGFDLRSENNFNLVTTGPIDGRAIITLDQPDTEVASLRGSIVKRFLTAPGRP